MPLTFVQLGFPNHAKIFDLAFLVVKIIKHNQSKIRVEILSYNLGERAFSNKQIGLSGTLKKVDCIMFNSIDTHSLFSLLKSKQQTNPSISNHNYKPQYDYPILAVHAGPKLTIIVP